MRNLSSGTLFKCYPGTFSSVSYTCRAMKPCSRKLKISFRIRNITGPSLNREFRPRFEFNNLLCRNLNEMLGGRVYAPIRADLSTAENVPKPTSTTLSPAFIALPTDARNASSAFLESFFERPDYAAIV